MDAPSRPSPLLRLRLEPHTNTLWFADKAVRGRHRWEAAVLAHLVVGRRGRPRLPCEAAELNRALFALGQRVALNRKQFSRLLQSLEELFAQQGFDFAARWRHAPRARTVGPWWWHSLPGDRITLTAATTPSATRSAETALATQPWPKMSRVVSLPALLSMCRLVLSYQSSWEGGPYASVLPVLLDDPAWRQASPEMQVMRWLQVTSSHLHTRRLTAASTSLQRAQRILVRDPLARAYLGSWAISLQTGLLRIDPEEERRGEGQRLLERALGGLPGAARPEADRLSRLFLFAFAAIGQSAAVRRAALGQSRAEALVQLQRTTALYSASLFCAFTGRHFDHMKSVLAHLGTFTHLLLELGLVDDASLPVHWFMLANQMRHKLGLVEDNWLISTGLGHCWLSLESARHAFDELTRDTAWAGPRPDELTFYTATAGETRQLGDPRYHSRALTNLVRFARRQQLSSELRRAERELQQLYADQPGLADLLLAEGWPKLSARR